MNTLEKQDYPIMVSIRCITYNHEPYIRQCLEGFVMQKTDFKFEAIVHDDASTDGTAAIIRELAEKYPDIIKPIYETENQYSKHDGSLRRIMDAHMRGKYIAMCEGDDYWIDPLKLQKQVDFMEAHDDYSMCFTNKIVKNETGKKGVGRNLFENNEKSEYKGEEILKKWIVPTATVLYRACCNCSIPIDKRFIHGDIVLFLNLVKNGRIIKLNAVTSVYRINLGGVTQKSVSFKRYVDHYEAIEEYFGYREIVKKKIIQCYATHFLRGKLNEESRVIIKTIILKPLDIPLFVWYVSLGIVHKCLLIFLKK